MPVATSPLPTSPGEVDQQTGAITVPMLLNQPTRVTRQVAAVAVANYWADRVLPNGGGVSGGGVVYDLTQPGDAYADREPEEIAPGAEFPISNASEPIPRTARVAKWGTKIKITEEKRDRNDVRYVQREQVRASNSMVRKLHANAVAAIDAAIAEFSRTAAWTTEFADIVNIGANQTPISERSAADVQAAQAIADSSDWDVSYNVLLVNTLDYAALLSVYPIDKGGVNLGVFPEATVRSSRLT